MNVSRPVLSFAICHVPGAPNAVRRLQVTTRVQEKISTIIDDQLQYFLDPDLERIEFDPTFTTDEESVLWINDFELPEHVREAVDLPLEVPPFTNQENIPRVKAIFHVSRDKNLFFQCWRNFSIFRNKFWILFR